MDLSVLVPAYNEQDSIKNTVINLKNIKSCVDRNDIFNNVTYEIVVVNDGSVDKTGEILSQLNGIKVVKNADNMGKGYSVKKGIGYCTGDTVAIFDADMAYDVKNIINAYRLTDSYDVIFGKRTRRGSYPMYRYVTSELFHFATEIYLKTGSIDTQCGFKMLKKSVINKIKKYITSNTFSYDMQIAYYVKKLGIKYANLDVTVKEHSQSSVKMLHDGIIMLSDIRRISRSGDIQ